MQKKQQWLMTSSQSAKNGKKSVKTPTIFNSVLIYWLVGNRIENEINPFLCEDEIQRQGKQFHKEFG